MSHTQLIEEPARTLPVREVAAVAVVGGGIAGAAAALASARSGAPTLLIEKEYSLGGLATLGNVIVYLPLCDGRGVQVSAGLSEELLLLSVKDGFEDIPPCWRHGGNVQERPSRRYRTRFNPASFMLNLEELLLKEGVDILYDTRLCAVRTSGHGDSRRITHLIAENKSGRFAIAAQAVVDATGDADLAAFAGEPTETLATNVACGWYGALYPVGESGGSDDKIIDGENPESGRVRRFEFKIHSRSHPFPENPEVVPNAKPYDGTNGRSVSQLTLESRDLVRRHLTQMAQEGRSVYPILLPQTASFRMTRRLIGRATLRIEDAGQSPPDGVGKIGHWRQPGPVFSLPLGTLLGTVNHNLFVAGRCISAAGEAWDVTRVIPACAVSGEAAGTAAALRARSDENRPYDHLFARQLRDLLGRKGVLL